MPWAGGTFTRFYGATGWTDDKNASINIISSKHDTHDGDLATGINAAITRDNTAQSTADFAPGSDAAFFLGNNTKRWKGLKYVFGGLQRTIPDQTTGTVGFYEQTAAELAALVTPVNPSIPPHTILGYVIPDRYGTNTTPGTTDMSGFLHSADLVAIQAGCSIGLLAASYRISASTTVVSSIVYPVGSGFTVDVTKVLTHTGAVFAGRQNLFSGAGLVAGLFGHVALMIDWFGAKADFNVAGGGGVGTGTDNGPAINRAIAARIANAVVNNLTQRSAIYIPSGNYMVTTEIDIAAGYEFYGDGRYTSFLVCPTTYAGIIVKFNGTGGPFSTLRQLAVACLQGGSPGQGIVLTSTANGTLMNDFYVAGFNNVNGGLVLDSTDVFADNFLVENCTTNLYLRGAYCNVTHGELYGGNTGVSMDNSAMTQPGVTTLVSIRCTNNAVTGFSINNSHDLVMEGCSAGYNNNTALSSAGLSISGSSSNINVNNFNGIIGTANSTTSNGIQITGTANNITITDGGCNGFNIGALISTSGTNIQINGGKYNLNNITGVDFNNWTGLVLHINGVQANTNGTIGTPGQGFNGVVHTANQRLVMCGCMAGQLTGAAIQNYGILVDCTQASAKGAITGCATFFNTLGALVITGAQAAQITLTGNV